MPSEQDHTELLLPASGLPPVPHHLVQAISANRFIELGELLPEALREAHFEQVRDSREETKGRKPPKLTTPLDWMVAFSTYMAVAVHCHPQRAFELAAYASIIANLACDGHGMAWARYDRTLRQAAAVNPRLPWSRREQDIWLMAALDTSPLPTPSQPPPSRTPPIWHPSASALNRDLSQLECWPLHLPQLPLSPRVPHLLGEYPHSEGLSPGEYPSAATVGHSP